MLPGPATALVVTATGKFFSNGLDVDWVMADASRWPAYVDRVQALFSRTLTLPVPTVRGRPRKCRIAALDAEVDRIDDTGDATVVGCPLK